MAAKKKTAAPSVRLNKALFNKAIKKVRTAPKNAKGKLIDRGIADAAGSMLRAVRARKWSAVNAAARYIVNE